MGDSLDTTGLQVKTVTDLVNDITTSMQSIYGSDINVASNSPDGQLINIFAQAAEDQRQLLVQVYNSFTVANAYGTILDARVAMIGMTRQQGTYTVTNVTLTATQSVTLTGLDALIANPNAQVFTVADNAGNQFQLVTTTPISAGTTVLAFQAASLGQIETTLNTITNFVTQVLGVTSANNPTVATTVGLNEETDAQLKVRFGRSFSLPATGPSDSISGMILNTPGVRDASVIENNSGSTDGNGTVAHSIWTIVNGGSAPLIGAAIYAKKMPGCGMRGSQSTIITRPNGTTFTAVWDNALSQPLYIKFSILWRGAVALDNATIGSSLAALLTYKLNQPPNIGDVVTAMLAIAPTAVVIFSSNQGVSSDGVTYSSVITPTSPQYYFTLNAANIAIV